MATTTEPGSSPRRAGILLLLNTSMLLVHQIDAAFWHEWDMFGLPGGNQLNLLLNVPIAAFVVYAYGEALRNEARSRHWTKINACLGFITLAIHTAFFIVGHAEFLGVETRIKVKKYNKRDVTRP